MAMVLAPPVPMILQCGHHGNCGDFGLVLDKENFAKMVFDAWEKESKITSLSRTFPGNGDYAQALIIANKAGTNANMKEAWANIGISYHRPPSKNIYIQFGCRICGRASSVMSGWDEETGPWLMSILSPYTMQAPPPPPLRQPLPAPTTMQAPPPPPLRQPLAPQLAAGTRDTGSIFEGVGRRLDDGSSETVRRWQKQEQSARVPTALEKSTNCYKCFFQDLNRQAPAPAEQVSGGSSSSSNTAGQHVNGLKYVPEFLDEKKKNTEKDMEQLAMCDRPDSEQQQLLGATTATPTTGATTATCSNNRYYGRHNGNWSNHTYSDDWADWWGDGNRWGDGWWGNGNWSNHTYSDDWADWWGDGNRW